jgi:hypothetical protein
MTIKEKGSPHQGVHMMEQTDRRPMIALACGVVGVIAAFLMYWMVLPSVLLGIAAVVVGMRARKGDAGSAKGRELAAAAIALGLVAILGTGGSYLNAEWAEDYGYDCALDPSPDC